MQDSVEFKWDLDEMNDMVESCKVDDAVNLTIQYILNKKARILEAGSGTGRVIKYLNNLGYLNIEGIELNKKIVNELHKKYPEITVKEGNILRMPYKENAFDVIVSYGVIEHFPKGPDLPLKALLKVLKPGGIAIVTVPSFNFIRSIISFFSPLTELANPLTNPLIRKIFSCPSLPAKNGNKPYYIYPQRGPFFEYWLTPKQFEDICRKSGFEIIESTPICHIDGLYHIFGSSLVKFQDWRFHVYPQGALLNYIFRKFPFFHNHMHLCVLRKPTKGLL